MSDKLEKFNAKLDEKIKELFGPDFIAFLDYEKGLAIKYSGIEERNIDTPGVMKIVELVALDLAKELKFDLENYME